MKHHFNHENYLSCFFFFVKLFVVIFWGDREFS